MGSGWEANISEGRHAYAKIWKKVFKSLWQTVLIRRFKGQLEKRDFLYWGNEGLSDVDIAVIRKSILAPTRYVAVIAVLRNRNNTATEVYLQEVFAASEGRLAYLEAFDSESELALCRHINVALFPPKHNG